MGKKSFPGKGLSSTQTSSSKGTPASGVVKQTNRELVRGPRMDPPGKQASGFGFGKNLSNTNTRNSSTVQSASEPAGQADEPGADERGKRQDPPRGARFPGKGLSNAQTRNSPPAQR